VFADAKEKHSMRYTNFRGVSQATNWVKHKFAAMDCIYDLTPNRYRD